MRIKILNSLKYFLLLAIAVVLLLLAFRGTDVKKILHQVFQANLFWVFVSGMLSIIAFIIRAQRWNLLIEPMGYSPSLKNTSYSLMVGYFANLALPRLGEVSRCGALSKAEAIPFNKLLGTVVVERVIDVISLLICILLAAVIEFKRLGNFLSENIFDPLIKKFSGIVNSPLIIVAGFLGLAGLILALIFLKRKGRGTQSAISKLIRGFLEGIRSVVTLENPLYFIVLSILIWVLYYLGVYVTFFAFSFTSTLDSGAALFLLVTAGIAMSAPVQGGIGTYHLLVSQGLMLYGLSQQEGLTFATLLHGFQVVLVLILGVASLLLLFSSRNKSEKKENQA